MREKTLRVPLSRQYDEEFTEYVTLRLPALRRVAFLLCQDWHRADDLVQMAITKLYTHWGRVRAAEHIDAYTRTILVREFLRERRSGWARKVLLDGGPVDGEPPVAEDREMSVDLRAALARLPSRQRATLVLRFYCDLTVFQVAELLGCTPGTVKSQTAKALSSLRRAPEIGAFRITGQEPGGAHQLGRSEVRSHG